jgi:hypothetical protein
MKMVPHRLIYLNTWPPIGGTVWELSDVSLLVVVCCHEWVFRFEKSILFPVSALSA